MNSKNKDLITAISSGNPHQMHQAAKEPVCIVELTTREEGKYTDASGKEYTEAEMQQLLSDTAQKAHTVFTEIKTY